MNHFHDYTTKEDRLYRHRRDDERESEVLLDIAFIALAIFAFAIAWNIRNLHLTLLALGI